MDRLIRGMKGCGVAVLLAVSLLSAGHPVLSPTDSVSFLSTRPATMQLSEESGLAAVLQHSEGRALLFYAPESEANGQTSHLGVWAAPAGPAVSAVTVQELLAGNAPTPPHTAVLALDVTQQIGGN